jgi:hypothetical protein
MTVIRHAASSISKIPDQWFLAFMATMFTVAVISFSISITLLLMGR